MLLNNKSCKIIKFADDTIILGLISDNDETEYKNVTDFVTNWCDNNYLELNVSKTIEMVFDFRKTQNVKSPVTSSTIHGNNVSFANSYKYLVVTIQDDLKWDCHITNQVKKANKGLPYSLP